MHTLYMMREYAYILYIVILESVVKNYQKVDILSVEICTVWIDGIFVTDFIMKKII